MDVLLGSLFNILISSSLSAPRIWWNKEARSYEEARDQRLSKLPEEHSIKRLRAKLSRDELAEVEARERKIHDVYEEHLRKSAREAGIAASFWEGEDALPPAEQDFRGSIDSFALPGQLYAGPRYSGGRFFGKGEKLTAKDLAVLPTSDWDLYSRSHDARFALISAIPDAEKRAELRDVANSLYHYQIYLSDDLPKEVGEISQHFLTNEVLPVALSLRGTKSLVEGVANRIVADILSDVNRFTEETRMNYEAQIARRRNPEPGIDDDIQGNDVFFREPRFQQPLDEMVGHSNPGDPLNEVYTGSRGPLLETYLNTVGRGSHVFRDPEVRERLSLDNFDEALIRLGELDPRSAEFRQIARELETTIARSNITFPDRDMLHHNVATNDGTENALPSVEGIVPRTVVSNLVGDRELLGKLAASAALDQFFKYVGKRGYSKYAEENPEMLAEIEKTVFPYERAHPFYKRLGELLFRQGSSYGIEYNPALTREDIELYLDSLDHVVGDPVVSEIRKLYPKEPPKKQEQVDLVDAEKPAPRSPRGWKNYYEYLESLVGDTFTREHLDEYLLLIDDDEFAAVSKNFE